MFCSLEDEGKMKKERGKVTTPGLAKGSGVFYLLPARFFFFGEGDA